MITRAATAAAIAFALTLLAAPCRAALECGSIADKPAAAACRSVDEGLQKLQLAADPIIQASNPDSVTAEQRNAYAAAKSEYQARLGSFDQIVDQRDLIYLRNDAGSDFFGQFRERAAAIELRMGGSTTSGANVPSLKTPDDKKTLKTESPAAQEATQNLNSGNPGAAEKSMDQVIAQNKNDPVALGLRAQARMAQGNREGALTDARQALELNPKDKASRALVSELEDLSRASGKIKGVKLDFGAERAPEGGMGGGRPGARPGSGEAALRSPAPGAGPSTGPTEAGTTWAGAATPAVRSLLQRAEHLRGIGDFTGALLPLREALDLEPNRPELWDMLAEISNKTGNFKGALAAAESALKINPGDARALRSKSYAEFQLGDYQRALEDAKKAVSADPGNGLGYLYRAMAEEKLGDKEKALADYRNAERLDPTIAPLAEEGIKRLGGAASPAVTGGFSPRLILRGGVIAVSTLLIVLGIMGTVVGRRLTTRGRSRAAPALDAESAETVAIGARLAGNYRVTRELGRGGMGVVYEAYDEALQRRVAIKQLQRDGRSSGVDQERFLREARLVAQLKHPHLAQIHSVINEGDLLLVFEYVDGKTLDQALAVEKTFTPEKTRRLIGQICGALEYAHGRKIVHRDLKPSNVMIDAAGQAKIMDFGIAHQSRGDASMTKTSASGTPPYMAPEQAMGSVSKSADLYALAVMTYEMLTGVRPFSGPDFLEPKLRGQFVPATSVNPGLPRPVDGFFARALDPDPTQRHTDAAEFARALNEALAAATNPA